MPHDRNPYFTGRETILTDLREALSSRRAAALIQAQAISGLGGVGKTQTALEYAYRYRDEYGAVFWANAETELELRNTFAEIAGVIGLPELGDSAATVRLVLQWLREHDRWLLILDNATNAEIIRPFLPRESKGEVLVTSRGSDFDLVGISSPVEITEMPPPEALSLLLKRTGREEAAPEERDVAADLAKELGWLPLALEQAAAYIKSRRARFDEYLHSYRTRKLELLERVGPAIGPYEKTVATTWDLNFQQVREESESSAQLLVFSAFLSPAPIPFNLLTAGADGLEAALAAELKDAADDPLRIKDLLEPLRRYSLIGLDRDTDVYIVHRLVQEVIRDSIMLAERPIYVHRILDVVNRALWSLDEQQWLSWAALVPHAQYALLLAEQSGIVDRIVGTILIRLGDHFVHTGQYDGAETAITSAVQILDRECGSEHPNTARAINDLGVLRNHQGRLHEAEPLYERALDIRERILGSDHPDTATSLNNLAEIYRALGDLPSAKLLHQRALDIRERVLGPDHPGTANSLGNFAIVHQQTGDLATAILLNKRALDIRERALGPDHPDTATNLNNLATVHRELGNLATAKLLQQRALDIRRRLFGPDHPNTAASLASLATIHQALGDLATAKLLQQRALEIQERVLGPDHPDIATSLNNLAVVHHQENHYSVALGLAERALLIREARLGIHHPDTLATLKDVAHCHLSSGHLAKAGAKFFALRTAYESTYGPDHPDLVPLLRQHAQVMRQLKRHESATKMEAQARQIERRLQSKGR